MTDNLRVLYLAPGSRTLQALSRYSFLDEEIRALADSGVHVYVLSEIGGASRDEGRIHVRALPSASIHDRIDTLAFLTRHLRHVPIANFAGAMQCYRSARIERFAADIIAREQITLIHSYFGWPRGFGGSLAKAATGVPLVVGLRGSDVNVLPSLRYGFRHDGFYDRAFRRLLRSADCTISVSEFLRGQALTLGADPATSRVILKGVRTDVFDGSTDRAAARASVGAGSAPMILAVAGLVPIKGLNHVLEALAQVRTAGREFSFAICGEGPERAALEAQARQLGLADCVRFAGKVGRSQITHYFAAADLLVHGSLIEASGNVLLEALASGLSIVCTDAGGPAEYVRDGVTGFVVPVADPAAMADRVMRLLDDPGLRADYGRRGREQARSEFAYRRMIADTRAIYDAVVGGPTVRDAVKARRLKHA